MLGGRVHSVSGKVVLLSCGLEVVCVCTGSGGGGEWWWRVRGSFCCSSDEIVGSLVMGCWPSLWLLLLLMLLVFTRLNN